MTIEQFAAGTIAAPSAVIGAANRRITSVLPAGDGDLPSYGGDFVQGPARGDDAASAAPPPPLERLGSQPPQQHHRQNRAAKAPT